MNSPFSLAAVGLALLLAMTTLGHAAPILGETQQPNGAAPAPGAGQATSAPAPATPTAPPSLVSSRSTVLEFTILPSATDPSVLETTIVLQQGGDNKVCVNHASDKIVVRSYQTKNDPFTPEISAQIKGNDSGNVGELVGFNSKKLFIKPKTDKDQFNLPDEGFTIGAYTGEFLPDKVQCDEELTEGQTVCVDQVIHNEGCAVVKHAGLERNLRLMLALNALPILAPAAGPPGTQTAGPTFGVTPPEVPGGGLPSGGVGAAPDFTGSFSGSGGGNLITVPNVIGLPLSGAMAAITGSGLTVGTITASQGNSTGLFDNLLVSTAFAAELPPNVTSDSVVVDQTPAGGSQLPPGSAINLIAQANAAPVPEPSTLNLLALGLALAMAMYWIARARSRRASR